MQNNLNLNYDLRYSHDFAGQVYSDRFYNFLSNFDGDMYHDGFVVDVHDSMDNLIRILKGILKDHGLTPKVFLIDTKSFTIQIDEKLFIWISENVKNPYGVNTEINSVNLPTQKNLQCKIYGEQELTISVLTKLKEILVSIDAPKITWYFYNDHEMDYKSITLDKPKKALDEFYPWLNKSVDSYFKSYLESDSPVLILLGETGTGKTSFIRNLIWESNLNTTFTYEDRVLGTDSFFVNFFVDNSKQLLIIEDADLLLTSREHDGNKIMSKLLNVGDGLVSLGKKKLIFTANLTDLSKIDTALLRPGRCFDYKKFRKLTMDEAKKAALVAGISEPPFKQDGYSLAEIFQINNGNLKPEIDRLGFKI